MRNKLYVGNLPLSSTEESLINTFSECGMVESVKLVMDQETGASRGFALVEMSTGSAAQEVIAKFHGSDCDGREMKINEAKPMQKRGMAAARVRKAW